MTKRNEILIAALSEYVKNQSITDEDKKLAELLLGEAKEETLLGYPAIASAEIENVIENYEEDEKYHPEIYAEKRLEIIESVNYEVLSDDCVWERVNETIVEVLKDYDVLD